MEIGVKTAAEALEEARARPKLATGYGGLDGLIGGIEEGKFYVFYGRDAVVLDLLIHRVLVNCVLPEEEGGLDGKALYLNMCNYYAEKTMLNPSWLGAISKKAGIEPKVVFKNVYSLFAFNEKQQVSVLEEAVKLLEGDGDLRLLAVHNLARFVGTSRKPGEAKRALRRFVGVLRRSSTEHGVALVASCGASRTRLGRLPEPEGGVFLRREADVVVFMRKLDGAVHPSVKACLVKHPHMKTPRSVVLHVSQGGMDLMGRVTPSFRQLYKAQIEELKKHFQSILLDLGHKEAFDSLVRDAWTAEDHALSNARVPTVLDVLNLMANVHNQKCINSLRKELKEIGDCLRELRVMLDSGAPTDGGREDE